MYEVRADHVTWRGHRIAYEVRGSGPRPIILVPGLLLPRHLNGQIANMLVEAGNTAILLDPIGQGQSDKPTHAYEYRMDQGPGQVLAVMDELGIEQAVVGGVSLGANFALMMATMHPDRLKGAVCEMPVLERGTVAALWMFGPLLLTLRFLPGPVRLFSRVAGLVPRPSFEPAAAVLDTIGDPREMAAVLHGYMAGPTCPSADARRKIATPMLVLGHKGDLLHPLDDATALANEVPGARLVESKSMFELRTRPKRLVNEIAWFLDDCWEGRAAATASN